MFGTPEQFLIGSLGNNLGRMLPALPAMAGQSLAQALVSGGRGLSQYLGGGGQQPRGGVMMPSFDFDPNTFEALAQIGSGASPYTAYGGQAGAPARPTGGQVDPRQALVTQRAMEDAELRRAIIAQRKLAANAPSGGRAAINQNFYKGLGLDTDIFNSATGPYGQLQAAAIATAPSRAARDIARIEAETARQVNSSRTATANRLIDALLSGGGIGAFGGAGVPLTGVKTDYGAGVRLSPIFLRSDLSRFIRPPR